MSLAALLAAMAVLLPFRLVLDAPDEAPPDTSLTWRAWTLGRGAEAEPVAAAEHVGAGAPRTVAAGLPSDEGAWFVLVEGEAGGDAWFALAAGRGEERAPLVAVPVASPSLSTDDRAGVRLEWDRVTPPLVAGWQVLRRPQRGEPELVGEVGVGASSFLDEPPPGEATWSLRPVFAGGVTGPLGRESEPVMVEAPEARVSEPARKVEGALGADGREAGQ